MKKKIALLIACLFLMSSVALAAPLTDYKAGKASIDLNYRNTKNTAEDLSFDRKFNFEPSVTYGIADKWAIQWRNASSKSGDLREVGGSGVTSTLTANEFNVLYSLTPEISAFAGYVSAKGTFDAWGTKFSDTKNTWQLGLLASVPLAEKVSAYGVIGAGDKWGNYELGLSYAFTPNWALNVDYRSMKVKDLDPFSNGDRGTAKTKGWGFGATYKFKINNF